MCSTCSCSDRAIACWVALISPRLHASLFAAYAQVGPELTEFWPGLDAAFRTEFG